MANPVTEPAKSRLMLIGAQTEEETEIREYTVTDGEGEVIFDLTRANACTVFERVGKKFYIRKELRLTDTVPAVMVGKRLHVTDVSLIKKAVLRATARGFYECYLNGQKVGNSYYAPGFTDYSLHIDYQEEDITDLIKQSGNDPFFSAIVTHGYYSGFCGYSGAEIYG